MNDFQFKLIVRLLFLIARVGIAVFDKLHNFTGNTLTDEKLSADIHKEFQIMKSDYLKSLK